MSLNVKLSTYTGNGSTRSITGVGFQPNFLIITNDIGDTPVFKTSDMPADSAYRFDLFTNLTSRIPSFDVDGFSLGTNNEVNGTSRVYSFIALKDTASLFDTFTYSGNGSDDRSLSTLVSFTPDFAGIRNGSVANATALRFKDEVGDNSFLSTGVGEAGNIIQAFISGGVQVGTAANVNTNTNTYYGWGFKESSAAPTVKPSRMTLLGAS